MKVAVGSKNPVKIQVVREVCKEFFDDFELISIDAPSGVSEMPFGNEESIGGARNRAKFCLENSDAELSFGLEGYVNDLNEGLFLSGWCVVINKNGEEGIGGKGTIRLPEKIAERVRNGEELGPVMDDVMNEKDTKKKEGAIGILTNNSITRKESFKEGTIFALSDLLENYKFKK